MSVEKEMREMRAKAAWLLFLSFFLFPPFPSFSFFSFSCVSEGVSIAASLRFTFLAVYLRLAFRFSRSVRAFLGKGGVYADEAALCLQVNDALTIVTASPAFEIFDARIIDGCMFANYCESHESVFAKFI